MVKAAPKLPTEAIEIPPKHPRREFRKYTSLAVAIHMLQRREIALLDPSSWDDRNDRHFMTEYKSIMRATNLFASCFSEAQETYHHWRVFASGVDGVCMEFEKDRFLATFASDPNIRQKTVDYAYLESLRHRKTIDPEELPFLKRMPYKPEAEYRVVYVDRASNPEPAMAYDLDLASIKRITLSPWMPPSLRQSIAKTIRSIDGCRDLKVSRSSLVENSEWKAMTEKARPPIEPQ